MQPRPGPISGPVPLLSLAPAAFRGLVEGLPGEALQPRDDGSWGVIECLAHVLDTSDIGFVTRIRRIVEEDRPFIRSIDPPARLRELGFLERSAADLLAELEARRAADLAWVAALPPAALDRVGDHDAAGEISARNILNYWVRHDFDHLRQALRATEALFYPAMGNTQKFFEDV